MLSKRSATVLAALLLGSGAAGAQTARPCAVQGSGPVPPALGSRVTVSGVVTAAFRGAVNGFFLQEPSCDGDAATSDALFVDARGLAAWPAAGNRATVTGRVANDAGLTSVIAESASDDGRYAGSVEAVRTSPPADPAAAAAYLESQEGMLVALAPSRVVGATDATGTAYVVPEASGVTRLYRGDADGRKLGLAAPEAWLAANHGDVVSDVSGPLVETGAGFAVWVRTTRPPAIAAGRAAAGTAAAAAPGTLSIATYDLGASGSAARRAQSIAALAAPDVLVVQGAFSAETLADLAAEPSLIAFGYRTVAAEGADPEGRRVGLLYRADRVSLRAFETRPAAVPGRAPLVVHLETPQGERFAVVGCDFQPAAGAVDAAAVRLGLADHVRALAGEIRLTEPDARLVVLGNLDDGETSAPVLRLLDGGLLQDLHGRLPVERPYTVVAQGLSLASDYVLVDGALSARVAELRAVHANADQAHAAPGAEASSARAADHDPLLLRVRPR
ncbi:MAG: hypothetical protein ABW221_24080 [Vicinamibacteria bacterium]